MGFERLFLGTGNHCLHAVRDAIVSRCPPRSGALALDHVLFALPSGRANRRLQELLLEAAWANGYTGRTFRDSRGVMDAAFGRGIEAAGNSTISIAGILSNVANKFLLEGFFSVERTWREAGDAAGTLRDFTQMQVSTSAETGSRWGDYAGLEEDPVDPGTFWNHHEYRTSSWRTWIGRFTPGDNGADLVLTLSLPLVGGQTNNATVDGSDPFTTVYLCNGSGPGSTIVPGLGELDIDNGRLLLSRGANSAGFTNINRFVPTRLSGFTVWLQAIDANGLVSNVETTTIQ